MNSSEGLPPNVGMTRVDLLYRGRWWMLAIIALIFISVILIAVFYLFKPSLSFSTEGLSQFINEYGVLIVLAFVCFIVFGQIGRIATERFLEVPLVMILCFDFEKRTGEFVAIPKPIFKEFSKEGNGMSFSWRNGDEFYFARNIDREKKIIDFGWPHKILIEEAAVLLASMQARDKEYTELKKENIILRKFSMAIGADFAKNANNELVSDLNKALGFGDGDEFDISEYVKTIRPLDVDKIEKKDEVEGLEGVENDIESLVQ